MEVIFNGQTYTLLLAKLRAARGSWKANYSRAGKLMM